jgi:hypothetical protein
MMRNLLIGLAFFSVNLPAQLLEKPVASGLYFRVPDGPRPLRKQVSDKSAQAPISLLGSVATPSSANSFALNGTLAYVCDDDEISVVNIANPANPQLVGTATAPLIMKAGGIHCSVQRGVLSVFSDQINTNLGNTPAYTAFSLANPVAPQLIQQTPLTRKFVQAPIYVGNIAYVPTAARNFISGWSSQHGDLLAYDLTNFAAPALLGTLMRPEIHPVFGGPYSVFGATQANGTVIYLGGSSSVSNQNNGVGRLQVAEVTTPAAMRLLGQVDVPGTVHFTAPLIQGAVAVGIGNTGGWVDQVDAIPITKGNVVVATFDVADRRSPALIKTVATSYRVGAGGGAARIGTNLFAFAGVIDTANNPVLLVVDITNPAVPVLQAYPVGNAFTSLQVVGSVMYATLGSGGFATYSVPGGAVSSLSCPTSLDTMVVFDRSALVSATAFTNAKNALKSFTNALQLPSDKLGVVSFSQTAALAQQLTGETPAARSAIDTLVPSTASTSYIGGGIVAAQTELTGPRRTATATPVMIVVSDGRDTGAPSGAATLTAANAAKAAGIRVIALQYGSSANTVMQSIASSASDFYLVP